MEQQVKFPELNWMKEKRKSPVYRPVRVEEDQRQTIKFRVAACEVACGLHLAAGVFMILFVDTVEQWPLLLLAILYCFLAGSFFGIVASAGRTMDDE